MWREKARRTSAITRKKKLPDWERPVWFDGTSINEALFREEFLREHRILFANRAFFTPDGRLTDELPLRGEIYEKLKCCAVNNIPRKINNILEVLKLEAQVGDFPPQADRIHLANGTLFWMADSQRDGRRLSVTGCPSSTAQMPRSLTGGFTFWMIFCTRRTFQHSKSLSATA